MSAVSRSRSADRRYYGVVEALVVDVVDPDDEGRVKIRFPWFDAAMVSEWCRVAYFYAGDDYGCLFLPEVGDEVLVAFVHGDMRLPIVIGGLYNGKDKPPTSRTADRDQKMVRTKGGHELLFDDSADQKRVEITSDAGHRVVLDDSANTITIETAAGQSIVIDGASGKATVKGATVTVDASSISLGGTASHPLVLGDLFSTLFNAHVHTCTAPGSPSSPPVTPMTPAMLSQVTKTG